MANRGVFESPQRGDDSQAILRHDHASADGLLRLLGEAGIDAHGLLAIADALPIMIAFVDTDLCYRFCNTAVADWFEVRRAALIGRSMRDIMGPEAFAQREPALAAALAGSRQRCVASFRHPARGQLTTQADYIPHTGPDGTVLGLILVVADVTEQRAAELAIKESEARFRRIADSTPLPVWVTRADSSLDFANQAFADLFEGARQGAFDWLDHVHPDDRDRFARLVTPGGGGGGGGAVHLTGRLRSGGDYRWYEISAEPRIDGEGRRIGHIVAAVDVTTAKQAELGLRQQVEERTRQLSENQGRFRAIFDSVTTLLVLMDPEGRILEVNNTPAPWRSSRMLEGIGGMLWDAPTVRNHPDVIPILHDMVERAQAGETVRREVPLTRDGVVVAWLDTVLQPVMGAGGAPGHLLLESRDISELRHAQDQLRQSQKMEALGQLTGGIAHDFNNLLTVVVGGLDLISKRTEDEAILRFARNALAAAERGARLTGQLLAFSRVQRLEARPIEIAALIDEIRPLLRNVLGPGIEKAIEIEQGAGLILADATQLEVAVLNLAINARDAMPSGGRLSIVSRRCTIEGDVELADGDYLELAIADTGEGMSSEVVERAFEPFFTTKDTGKGTGLGLSMVYGMARQSGGTARIESTPGEGTTVRLYFRIAEDGADAPAAATGDVRPAQRQQQAGRVLVIDDDHQVRDHLVAILEDFGHHVVAVAEGAAGLALVEELDPHLVILDFVMPGMSGADVARQLLGQRPDQQILFVTGYHETEAIRAVAPSAPLLAKPFRPEALESVLRDLDWRDAP